MLRLQDIHNTQDAARNVIERAHCRAAMPYLIGSSRAMVELGSAVRRVANSVRPILVTGPTGAGKELVVRAIHAMSDQADAPLLDLNCSAFPEALIESQLFGHEKGSFTGADRRHSGFFAAAGDGIVFLDELGELRVDLQAKLLRVLETGSYRPIGASTSHQFRGRIVAATCVDLDERVREGRFREDLYYRLNVLEVRVPSLEDRREDIPLLLSHFARHQPRSLVFSEEVIAFAQQMSWPGNVRQLRNVVDRLAVFAPEGTIDLEVFTQIVGTRSVRPPAGVGTVAPDPISESPGTPVAQLARAILKSDAEDKLRLVEDILIEEALLLTAGNKAAAARLLGVHRKVVERRTDRRARGADSALSPSVIESSS